MEAYLESENDLLADLEKLNFNNYLEVIDFLQKAVKKTRYMSVHDRQKIFYTFSSWGYKSNVVDGEEDLEHFANYIIAQCMQRLAEGKNISAHITHQIERWRKEIELINFNL
ncbi:MAG TPA: hypothetical protein PLQ36_02870 [Candidatus Gracilibacteria bacterium]|nr:hypothetical protein [Candidatus Gracilibacteria bacterium]